MTDALAASLVTALPGHAVVRELGGGGMSRVFLADDTALGRRVVIKILAGGAALNTERFRKEILLSARLQHPNIVPVLSAGDVEGVPFFVMPLVEGASLRTMLRQDGALPIATAVRLLRNVAAALSYAHQRGIVHRDIKPDNVIVSGGVAVVLDFGVSKALAASTIAPTGSLTSEGIAIGTPAYMAPEQAVGDPDVDARADVYALGVLAYEMLTATTPFAGRDHARVLRAHLLEAPPPVATRRPGIPPVIAALVMRCLEKDTSARPQSADEVLDLLDAMATPSGVHTAPRASVTSSVLAAVVPALVYAVACIAMILGLRWLANEGQIGTRLVLLGAIGSLLGLPVVVGAGLVLRLRKAEGL